MNSRVFFILLLIVGGVIIFSLTNKPNNKVSSQQNNVVNNRAEEVRGSSTSSLSQTQDMGAVNVEITPITIVVGEEMVFKLSLNTHSVELNYDYMQIVSLTDDSGNLYQATSWSGESSGHHLEGELVFEPFLKEATKLSLTLNGIDDQNTTFIFNQ